ncbi:UNVERIFIED_CONTAM: hypothetical protein H355_010374 [Colinus virginianus]|nr:hypothetical protein H355_010374 [Colinus virginianus]
MVNATAAASSTPTHLVVRSLSRNGRLLQSPWIFKMAFVHKAFGGEAESSEEGGMALDAYRKARGLNNTADLIDCNKTFVCPNYHPVPVVITRGSGAVVWDVEGKPYYDFLAGVSAQRLTMTLRTFYNDVTEPACMFMAEMFRYEKVLLMNTGAEAGESALKVARKWAYEVKGVPENFAKIIMCKNNYWGRTITACSSSTTYDTYHNFGPFTPGFELIDYDSIPALEKALEDPNVAAFFVEPIQGEGGVIIPAEGYLRRAHELCRAHNVLLIVDEIQTGLCRTGKLLASDYDDIHPDMLLLGKSLSGGTIPISAIFGSADLLNVLGPGTHSSTFGGNPLACAVAVEALSVLQDEGLAEKASALGCRFRNRMQSELLNGKVQWIRDIRGKGLLNAIEVNGEAVDAEKLTLELKENGILTKATRKTVLRFIPPLVITDKQLEDAMDKIVHVFLHHQGK